jgi:hypothetical protein
VNQRLSFLGNGKAEEVYVIPLENNGKSVEEGSKESLYILIVY